MRMISTSVNKTLGLGKIIAGYLKKGDIICLYGQLGSGKTVLVKGIAIGLGIKKNNVISPSFVLIRQHPAKLSLNHFDLYRLKSPENILELGYEEYLYGDGVSVVEWAEKLDYLEPREYLKIDLTVKGDHQRLLCFQAKGRRYRQLLENINPAIAEGHCKDFGLNQRKANRRDVTK